MKPEQVETVQDELRGIGNHVDWHRRDGTPPDPTRILDGLKRALAALNGEKEWTAHRMDYGNKQWCVMSSDGTIIADDIASPECAHRIASDHNRLPALERAAERAAQALDDWSTVHAPTECGEERIRQARKRISESGTLYYIAETVSALRAALTDKAGD